MEPNTTDDAGKKYKRPESVLVVVYTRSGKVLLLRRTDHAEFWQSVTGSMEWGNNSPLATAQRELQEETGIVALTLRDWATTNRYEIFPQWRYKYAAGVTHNTEHVFSLKLPDVLPVSLHPAEHSDYRWLDFPQALAQATSETNRAIILALGQEEGYLP